MSTGKQPRQTSPATTGRDRKTRRQFHPRQRKTAGRPSNAGMTALGVAALVTAAAARVLQTEYGWEQDALQTFTARVVATAGQMAAELTTTADLPMPFRNLNEP